jgi:VanZ family protein
VRRFLWLWTPVILQMIAIFFISNIPNLTEIPGGISDKTGHFIGYAILGACLLRALAGGSRTGVNGATAGLAWLFSTLYGATDETHQLFVPGRSASLLDLLADAIGGAAVVLLIWGAAAWIARMAKRREV